MRELPEDCFGHFWAKLCTALSNRGWGVFGEWPMRITEAILGQLMVSFDKTSLREPGDTGICREPYFLLPPLYSHAVLKLDMFQ